VTARSPLATALQSAVLLLFFGMIVFPIAWMMLTAFKLPRDVYQLGLGFSPTVQNFGIVFEAPWNIGLRIVNSMVVAFFTLSIAIPAAILSA
jgi:ABC-type glycerol-3-phosphate transport system permease component